MVGYLARAPNAVNPDHGQLTEQRVLAVDQGLVQPSTATDPQRLVSFISVVGCGTFWSIPIRQTAAK